MGDKRTKKVAIQVKRFDLQHPYGVIWLVIGYGLAIGFLIMNRGSPWFYFGLGVASMTLWLRTRNEIIYEEVNIEDLDKTLADKLLDIVKKWWDSIPSSRGAK